MKTYFTSDTHIGHLNMTRAGKDLCGRPFEDVAEMNHGLLEGINSTVPGDARLVMLGDNIMGNWAEGLEVVKQINAAEVIFLPGNHDKWSLIMNKPAKREWFAAELEAARDGFKVFMEDGAWNVIRSWNFVDLSDEWDGNPLTAVQFSHYPHEGESVEGQLDRYTDLRPTLAEVPIVCGHVHTAWDVRGNQFNAGVDVRGFKPVSEDEIASWLETLVED